MRSVPPGSLRKRVKPNVLFRAVEKGPATVVITDNSGNIVYVNEKFVELTGYSRAEATGMNPRILQSGRHSREFYRKMWRTLARGEDWRGEFCNRKKNGDLYWESALITPLRDKRGKTTHFMAIKEDITARKNASEKLRRYQARLEELADERSRRLRKIINRQRESERKLREAEFRYRTVANFTLDWEYWKAPDGAFIYMSPSVERIIGYRAEEFLEDPALLENLILPEDLPAWLAHHKKVVTDDTEGSLIIRIRSRSGDVLWIEHVCRTIWDKKKKFLGIRASNRDITDRKAAETTAQIHREELNRMNRLVTMGELTAALAHQLNQPLAAILSNAQAGLYILSGGEATLGEIKEILGEISSESERAGDIVSRIRGLMKKRVIDAQPLDLNTTVQDVVSLLSSDALIRNVDLRTEISPKMPFVISDAVQLQQVVLNLIVNALEAMADEDSGEKRIVVRTRLVDDHTARVDVEDNGPGFDESDLNKVFEPFYTSKESGLGIGLAINKRIVES